MPTITVPHQFFIDERKKLYNWKPDFWRELLQNSVDAGANRIEVSLTDCGGGQIRISVADNGCGMTRDVLDRVYFALGETTKTGGGSIGGFGRARIMTCFGHDKYEIETLTNHVRGTGGEYMIDDIERQDGCIIRVWMSDTTIDEMRRHLNEYLRCCSLDRSGVMVRINGEVFSDYIDRGRRVRELSFAGIHVNRSGTFANRVIFRVGGLMMFWRHVNCKKQVVVEIDPDRAREVLAANRNEFVGDFRSEVNRWIDELTVDDRSALRDRNRETRRIISGSGRMMMLGKRTDEQRQLDDEHRQGKAGSTAPIETEGEFSPIATISGGDVVTPRSAALAPISPTARVIEVRPEPMPGDRFAPDLFDVMIINETGDPAMDKVVDRFNPENWTHEVKTSGDEYIPYKRGREAYRLLIAWKIAIEEALRVLVDEFNYRDISWSVGWVFGWQEGCHLDTGGCHVFCLNPVDGTKTRYRLTNKGDLLALLAIAKHEAAHARVDAHNETWGNTLTEIDKQYDTQAVLRRIKSELAALDV